MIILGIDPGLSGALALFDARDGSVQTHDMPTLPTGRGSRRAIDFPGLARMLDRDDIAVAYVEEVAARPNDGAVQAFAFGTGYGAILGALAANFIPVTLVKPEVWKRGLQIGRPGPKDDIKAMAVARANQLMPKVAEQWAIQRGECNKEQQAGRAEAALIALYGARQALAAPEVV